jgi:hypothetical protein
VAGRPKTPFTNFTPILTSIQSGGFTNGMADFREHLVQIRVVGARECRVLGVGVLV